MTWGIRNYEAALFRREVSVSHINRNALLARRIKAIQDAGTMTPKAQRGLDRLAVRLNEKRK